MVTEVARHLMIISELQFALAGSLYLSPNGQISNTATVSREPFSFIFDNLSLSNIMVNCLRYLDLFCCSLRPVDRQYWQKSPGTLISKLLRLFCYENVPGFLNMNGCKLQTTTMSDRNFGMGLKMTDNGRHFKNAAINDIRIKIGIDTVAS